MKLSLSWLSEYVAVPDTLQELARVLTDAGLEVEGAESRGDAVRGVIVGEVRSCEKHPDATKLSVCGVFDGATEVTVVCGAPNVRQGQHIAFAPVGTVLPAAGITIGTRTLRGVASSGMICSESELGISSEHAGILVLPADTVPGMPLAEALGWTDASVDIGITPNRGDALSHAGIARDIAAVTGTPLRLPEVHASAAAAPPDLSITILNPELCPRYSGAVIRGCANGPSPAWMAARLEAAGMRSISLLVDVTNYVMLEIGQPMHAFDLTTLEGMAIVVRAAFDGERFTTLDGVDHDLPERALLICDAVKPVALAGVMGGRNSEISPGTTDVLLESASFAASSVRRTAKRLGISTESSYRFERGTDPNRTVWALQRAVDLLIAHGGGSFQGILDCYPAPVAGAEIALDPARVRALLGISLADEEIVRILTALGVTCRAEQGRFRCTAPTWRSDLEREVDLIEELARIHGYDNIPTPEKIEIHSAAPYDEERFVTALRTAALGLGIDEVLTTSLIARENAELFTARSGGAPVPVLNPVSAERPCLRPSLLASMLETVSLNIRRGTPDLSVFEIGSTFTMKGGGESPSFEEASSFAVLHTGRAQRREWYGPERTYDFFDLKGSVEAMLRKFHVDKAVTFHYDRSSSLSKNELHVDLNGISLGRLIEFSDDVLRVFDIDQPVFAAELMLPVLETAWTRDRTLQRVSRFPQVDRDLAFLLPAETTAEMILDVVRKAHAKHLRDARIVDVFTHESFGPDRKSVALTLTFQSGEGTLTESDISGGTGDIARALLAAFDATLRTS